MGTILPEHIKEVVNPFNESDSKNRLGLMVNGPWDKRVVSYIKENNIKALYLNSAFGWNERDYSFLRNLDDIEEISITGTDCENLNALEGMVKLQRLSLNLPVKEVVDFSALRDIKYCSIKWWKGAESIFKSQVKDLVIDRLKIKDFSQLSKLLNVERLVISNSPLIELDWVEYLNKLNDFSLINCKKIKDFSKISCLVGLERLTIRGNKFINDLSFLKGLDRLEVLILSDNGDIGELSVLRGLKKLSAVAFGGSTKIIDGDLTPLAENPNLSMIMFAPRRHYTHKLIEPWSWDNFKKPRRLLVRK